jgi:hypothetical protein
MFTFNLWSLINLAVAYYVIVFAAAYVSAGARRYIRGVWTSVRCLFLTILRAIGNWQMGKLCGPEGIIQLLRMMQLASTWTRNLMFRK